MRAASFVENSSARDSWTKKRLAAVQASPMLRILASIAPSTARSTSASSKTRNGALPPSSIDTRSSCSADCSTSILPTAVEPVKVSLRRRSSRISGSQTAPECVVVMTLRTPSGSPASWSTCGEEQHRQRGLVRRLDDHRAAGRDGGADLAGAHREREVPGRDHQRRPDRLLHRQQARGAVGGHGVAAVDAHRLLGEPPEELRAVGHLAARLGDRLAHLERHERGELVGPRDERLEGGAEDLAAVARRGRGPAGLGRVGRREGGERRPRGCRRRTS